jgi:hypothetical protein
VRLLFADRLSDETVHELEARGHTCVVEPGLSADDLPGWGLLGAPVIATVLDADATPYCTSSPDPELARILQEEWDHELVLPGLPPA